MGKIPDELRGTIAKNIRACRVKKFPGRGGAKKCAEAFGVSPQQWSPWERGMRTPDESRLALIAKFFDVTVEYLRRNHDQPPPFAIPHPWALDIPTLATPYSPPSGMGMPPLPPSLPRKDLDDIYWVLAGFFNDVGQYGVRMRLAPENLDYICDRIARMFGR